MKLMLLLCLSLSGCAAATIQTETPEGKKCVGSYFSLFRDIDEMSLSACGSKGSSTGSKANTVLMQELLKVMIPVP